MQCAHEHERDQREERDHAEQRELVAGPVDAGALGAPEAAEAGEQETDDELDRVFRHARERPLREDSCDDHDHECDPGAGGCESELTLSAAEGDHDEDDLEPLE
jgi:hypothetical protein